MKLDGVIYFEVIVDVITFTVTILVLSSTSKNLNSNLKKLINE